MATAKSGLVEKVKAAAAKAGTRGAKALLDTTVAAVHAVDKLQEKLGMHTAKHTEDKAEAPKAAAPKASSAKAPEVMPVALRDSGRKTVATTATAPKRSKASASPTPGFKVKRGQKHRHSGR